MQSLLPSDVLGYGVYSYLALGELQQLSLTDPAARQIYQDRLQDILRTYEDLIFREDEIFGPFENFLKELGTEVTTEDNPYLVRDVIATLQQSPQYSDRPSEEIFQQTVYGSRENIIRNFSREIFEDILDEKFLEYFPSEAIDAMIIIQPPNIDKLFSTAGFGRTPIESATTEQLEKLLDIYSSDLPTARRIAAIILEWNWPQLVNVFRPEVTIQQLTSNLDPKLAGKIIEIARQVAQQEDAPRI